MFADGFCFASVSAERKLENLRRRIEENKKNNKCDRYKRTRTALERCPSFNDGELDAHGVCWDIFISR